VAIKIVLRKQFELEPSKWQDQMKEIDMLKRADHEGCVRLLDTYQLEEALYIVMVSGCVLIIFLYLVMVVRNGFVLHSCPSSFSK
jgi:serine/threonine protein kinase